jgi:hypothetical protein
VDVEDSTKFTLKLESVASNTNNSSLNLTTTKSSVRVRNLSQSTNGSLVLLTTEVIILGNSIALIVRVQRSKRLLSLDKHIRLYKSLSTIAGVDGRGKDIFKVVIEDVAGTEADGGETGGDVGEVVVGVGDVEVAGVFGGVVVGVADERTWKN